jgi:N-carbamoyl-L-amino-acid hydrolase
MNLTIDTARLIRELETLAGFSDAPAPAVTRVLFTDKDMAARAYFKGLCREAGLSVREDAVGNIFARWGDPAAPGAVGTGSHTDAIPHSGRYDGTVGVFGGLEAIRALQSAGVKPRRPIELLMFTSEEPTRFGLGCLGSRLLSGAWTADRAAALKDAEGRTLEDVRTAAGCTGPLEGVRLPEGYYSAFVELHIEQGPLLEREGLPIGVVTAIAAPAALSVTIEGDGGHAGAVLMPDRKDALCAAAEIILAAESAAKGTGAVDTVATVGLCKVHPGAVNSVPSRVELGVDVRDIDADRRDGVLRKIESAIAAAIRGRGVRVNVTTLNADPPATCGESVVRAAESAAKASGLPFKRMVSRAYHDSLFMARIAPTGMIFIPCRNGWSHRPDEYSSPEAVAAGVRVLALSMAELAGA